MTPARILHALAGSPEQPGCAPLGAPSPCWLCARPTTRGTLVSRWMGASYTDQSRSRCSSSRWICEACVWCCAWSRPPGFPVVEGRGVMLRLFSHLYAAGTYLAANKDSVVVADLIARAGLPIPLVWVRVEPVENPDCVLVRDAFRALYPEHPYDEIEIACERHGGPVEPRSVGVGSRSPFRWAGTLERGFALAAERHGDRYISGVRAAESGPRKMRMRIHGVSTARTCSPIGWWSTAAVFAYLHAHRLPVHPAYAMTAGGAYPRDRLRVAALGGSRGSEFGRREWERAYYPDQMAVIDGWRKPQ